MISHNIAGAKKYNNYVQNVKNRTGLLTTVPLIREDIGRFIKKNMTKANALQIAHFLMGIKPLEDLPEDLREQLEKLVATEIKNDESSSSCFTSFFFSQKKYVSIEIANFFKTALQSGVWFGAWSETPEKTMCKLDYIIHRYFVKENANQTAINEELKNFSSASPSIIVNRINQQNAENKFREPHYLDLSGLEPHLEKFSHEERIIIKNHIIENIYPKSDKNLRAPLEIKGVQLAKKLKYKALLELFSTEWRKQQRSVLNKLKNWNIPAILINFNDQLRSHTDAAATAIHPQFKADLWRSLPYQIRNGESESYKIGPTGPENVTAASDFIGTFINKTDPPEVKEALQLICTQFVATKFLPQAAWPGSIRGDMYQNSITNSIFDLYSVLVFEQLNSMTSVSIIRDEKGKVKELRASAKMRINIRSAVSASYTGCNNDFSGEIIGYMEFETKEFVWTLLSQNIRKLMNKSEGPQSFTASSPTL